MKDEAKIAAKTGLTWKMAKDYANQTLSKDPSELAQFLSVDEYRSMSKMNHIKVELTRKDADGYVIPLGTINLVNVVTDVGMVGCGAFDVTALNNFGYPAAKVRPSSGSSIATIDDLLAGIVKEVNPAAEKLGLKVGITGKEALELL